MLRLRRQKRFGVTVYVGTCDGELVSVGIHLDAVMRALLAYRKK